MQVYQPLSALQIGQTATVMELESTGQMRRRLLDLGLVENTQVVCVGCSPAGDPTAYLIRGAVIAIRAIDGNKIRVRGAVHAG